MRRIFNTDNTICGALNLYLAKTNEIISRVSNRIPKNAPVKSHVKNLAPHITICELGSIIDEVQKLEGYAAKLPSNEVECDEMEPDKLLESVQAVVDIRSDLNTAVKSSQYRDDEIICMGSVVSDAISRMPLITSVISTRMNRYWFLAYPPICGLGFCTRQK